MQLITIFTALCASLTAVSATPVEQVEARQIFYCGSQPYKKSEYVCLPGNKLCPIRGGVAYRACGTACYSPYEYVCIDGFLCPRSAPRRCGAACYNPAQYWCDHGVLKQVGQH